MICSPARDRDVVVRPMPASFLIQAKPHKTVRSRSGKYALPERLGFAWVM